MMHNMNPRLLRRIRVTLAGVGGTGSQVLSGLARLHLALRALGHPGLEVEAVDPDRVTRANVGRQLFSPSDVGVNKAVLLTHRLNAYYGLDFRSAPAELKDLSTPPVRRHCDLVIGCVDTRSARREIADYCREAGACYWLDCGNSETQGQVILGEPLGKGERSRKLRLPTVAELFPSLMDASVPDSDAGPSCSLAEALESQDLFVNQTLATLALELFWRLVRHAGLDHHGFFVDLENGTVLPLAVDPAAWRRIMPRASAKGARRR
jgi:PRTRC genetic system ThiF family protein